MKREFISTVWIILLAVVAISFSCKKGPVPSLSGNPADYDPAGQALVTADQGADLLGDIGPQAQSMAKVPKGTVIDLLRMKSGVAPGVEDPNWAIASHQGKIGWIGTGSIFRYDLARVKELPERLRRSILVIEDGDRQYLFNGLQAHPRMLSRNLGSIGITGGGMHLVGMTIDDPDRAPGVYSIYIVNITSGDMKKCGSAGDLPLLEIAPGDKFFLLSYGSERGYYDIATGKNVIMLRKQDNVFWIGESSILVNGPAGKYKNRQCPDPESEYCDLGLLLFNLATGRGRDILAATEKSDAILIGMKSDTVVFIREDIVDRIEDWHKEGVEAKHVFYEFDMKNTGAGLKKIHEPASSTISTLTNEHRDQSITEADKENLKKSFPRQYAGTDINAHIVHLDMDAWVAAETQSGVFILNRKGPAGSGIRILPKGRLVAWR